MGFPRWASEREEWLREQVAAGYSASIIAHLYEKEFAEPMTRNAVVGKSTRLGLQGNRQPGTSRRPMADATVKFLNGEVRKRSPRPRRIEVAQPLNLSILDLKFGQCRYPYGEGPFTFCGQRAHIGSSYCYEHHRICHGGSIA